MMRLFRKWLARKISPELTSIERQYRSYAQAALANQAAVVAEARELERKFGPGGYWKHKFGLSMTQSVIQVQNERAMKTLYLPKP